MRPKRNHDHLQNLINQGFMIWFDFLFFILYKSQLMVASTA